MKPRKMVQMTQGAGKGQTNWKILKEMGLPDHLTCLLRNLYAGQEATVEPDMKQQTGSTMGKNYVKAVYCHPVYLTYTQNLVQFSRSVMSDSLGPRGLQDAGLPCPSPTPGACSNSCPSNQ